MNGALRVLAAAGGRGNVLAGASRNLWLAPPVILGCTLLGFGLAVQPWLTAGFTIGTALVTMALLRPLWVVGLMLVLGPIDLSFVTGGFKNLFADLGGLDMNGIRLIGLTMALSAVAISDRGVLRRIGSWQAMVYLTFMVYAAATLAWSPAQIDGARLLLKLGYPLLVFVIVAGVATEPAQVRRLTDWILIGAVLITLVINPLYVASGGYEVDWQGWVRLRGVGIHQNPFSFYLLAITMIALVRFSTRGRFMYLALCAVCAAWMGLTLTRITFLAVLVGLGTMALYSAVVARNMRVLVGAGLVGTVFAALFLPPILERSLGFVPTPGELVSLMQSPRRLYLAINWQGREVYWPVAIAAYLQQPLTGLGLGGSTAVLRANFPNSWSMVLHNEYLRLLTDTGIIGVTLFASSIMIWLGTVARIGSTRDATVREFTLPAIGCIAAWSIIAITDNAFDYYAPFTQFVGFLCAGALVASKGTLNPPGTAVAPPENHGISLADPAAADPGRRA